MLRPISFLLIVILLTTIHSSSLFSQPQANWIHSIDAGAEDAFYDVYATSDSFYVAVGGAGQLWAGGRWFVTKFDPEGRVVWQQVYGNQVQGSYANSVIETDDGDYVIAGASGYPDFGGRLEVMRISPDGEVRWRNQYMAGLGSAIIELKSGELLICGRAYSMAGLDGGLVMLTGDGREVWSRTYDCGFMGYFNAMRETDGEVVLAGNATIERFDGLRMWILKVNMENRGGVVWEKYHRVGQVSGCNAIISCEGGFILSGSEVQNLVSLMKINHDGDEVWSHIYESQNPDEGGYCLAKLDDGGYALGGRAITQWNVRCVPMVIYTDSEGRETGRVYTDIDGNDGIVDNFRTQMISIVRGFDNSLVGVGWCDNRETSYDGLILQLEPAISGPRILRWTPLDSILFVLPGDSIQFSVHGFDQWVDTLYNYWWIDDGDTISNDTTVTIGFDDLGEFVVHASVSDGRLSEQKNWYINVVQFYLRSFRPENTHFIKQRRHFDDFILDVACVPEHPLEYNWTLLDRSGQYELEGTDSVRVTYELTGNSILRAAVGDGNRVNGVEWTIDVVSPLWWWTPEFLSFRAPIDSIMDFELIPFNPASDSLTYAWVIGEDTLSEEIDFAYRFRSAGQYAVKAYIRDGSDIDSVAWDIECYDPNGVDKSTGYLPSQVSISSVFPNPFNSKVHICYNLPVQSHITLRIIDINGRTVGNLIDELQTAGNHQLVWYAANLTSGLYFVEVTAMGSVLYDKMLLIR